ncbi:hypothetical protein [uncultured Tateyamaria sp.]|uniref:hypothetical protein n=1 Tax=uncultured Tateyamaria sp. TaxID=455651 RepID=UPI002610BCAE|nr:hypothetical protein [uncultured Tateyamaria sp.]
MSLPLALLVTFISFSSAYAQSASFRSVDSNSDGSLSFDELVAAFGRDGATRLMRSTDHNGDSRITIRELRRGPREEPEGGTSRSGSGDNDDDDRDDRNDRDDNDDNDDNGGDNDGGGGGGGDNGGDSDGGDDNDD